MPDVNANLFVCNVICREHDGGRPARRCRHNGADTRANAAAGQCPHPAGTRFTLLTVNGGAAAAGRPGPAGVGDDVAAAIKALTFGLIRPCARCVRWAAWLNEKMPYPAAGGQAAAAGGGGCRGCGK